MTTSLVQIKVLKVMTHRKRAMKSQRCHFQTFLDTFVLLRQQKDERFRFSEKS